ncbi:MAG: DUF115 domain-containing protein [Magnetococcales bacterium]|nr:DUF115 domain-containing protein [Magnetococcales bacterium]
MPESFGWLRQHRESLVILAVARVADSLRREGIVPDFVFAIDPHDVIFHQSKGMLSLWQDTVLVNMFHLNPSLLSQWQGQSLFMGALFPWESALNSICIQYPGITVGHQALGVAIDMGFSQVVMAGFDLCFSREGFTHVVGSVEQEIGPFVARSDLMVETNGGWMAETKYDFLNAIPSLAILAEYASERNCHLVNPAAGAAKIAGVNHRPWEEVVPEKMEKPAKEVITSLLPQETEETRLAHYRAVETELVTMRKQVAKVKELAIEGIACNDGLFGRKGKPPQFKFKKRMDEIEETLDGTLLPVSRLVKKWGLGGMLKLGRPDKEREWSDAEIEQAGRKYYEIYRDNAVSLIKILDEVRQRIASRQEEEKPRPNYRSLLAQWKKDGQPGRSRVFLHRRQIAIEDLPPAIGAGFEALLLSFQALLDQKDNDYKRYLLSIQSSPMDVRAKASAMFRNKDQERLRQFCKGLEQSSLEERHEYCHLVRGYLAELEQQPEVAIRHYRQVTHTVLLTESLQRIFTVALQDHDLLTALAVSKRLAQYSYLHIPFHAELLRISGEKESAVSIFEDYLKVVQKDFVTMMKLGRLYLELGRIEDARNIFARILVEDPDNKAAQTFLSDLD